MNNIISKKKQKNITGKLTQSILMALIPMTVVWLAFYLNTDSMLNRYVNSNMNHASKQIISRLEESFLQMEELSYALMSSPEVEDFVSSDSEMAFIDGADAVTKIIERYQESEELMEHIVFYTADDMFYRFNGTLNNVSVQRVIQLTEGINKDSSMRITIDDCEYIGYISVLYDAGGKIGTLVILAEESTIYRVFDSASNNADMHIALAADGTIIISRDESVVGRTVDSITENSDYCSHDKIGFTPFELIITYENAGREIRVWFISSMLALTVFLLIILVQFITFWKRCFFAPIQQVISNVEKIGEDNSEKIEPTGMEHFDGLVENINDMIGRIEQKDKEIYEVSSSLKEAELRKQRALIVSLKKQISAHFTVNVLSVIKALSSSGENEKAGSLCDGLSYLLRYANAGDSYISGMEEFSILQRYVDIMEIRYPGRFETEIDYDDELEDISLPRMLLQPIVENSIVHGMDGCERLGRIHIYSEFERDTVRFVIEDNGKGMTKDALDKLRDNIKNADGEEDIEGLSHVALGNIQRRIVSYYGIGYGVEVESELSEGTKVIVSIPR